MQIKPIDWKNEVISPSITAITTLIVVDWISFVYAIFFDITISISFSMTKMLHFIPFIGDVIRNNQETLWSFIRPNLLQMVIGYICCLSAIQAAKSQHKTLQILYVLIILVIEYIVYCFLFKSLPVAYPRIAGCLICAVLISLLMYQRREIMPPNPNETAITPPPLPQSNQVIKSPPPPPAK